jgi:hypothetical protein
MNQGSHFVESAEKLGLAYPANAVDAALADFDADGALDIYILGWKQPGRLFRNAGPAFVDATEGAGLARVGGDGFSVASFDFNRDSRPDLLITSHAPLELSLQRLLDPLSRFNRSTPRLFLNTSDGRFEEATASVGLNRCFGVVKALPADFDGDGWSDLLFSLGGLDNRHFEPSIILRNDEGRQFTDWEYLPSLGEPVNSMGAAVADLNGDGRPDSFLSGAGVLINRVRQVE